MYIPERSAREDAAKLEGSSIGWGPSCLKLEAARQQQSLKASSLAPTKKWPCWN